jgi:hypothetical protein
MKNDVIYIAAMFFSLGLVMGVILGLILSQII